MFWAWVFSVCKLDSKLRLTGSDCSPVTENALCLKATLEEHAPGIALQCAQNSPWSGSMIVGTMVKARVAVYLKQAVEGNTRLDCGTRPIGQHYRSSGALGQKWCMPVQWHISVRHFSGCGEACHVASKNRYSI
jgi:hypothetical protein